MTPTWQDAPLTFVAMPACPGCRSVRYSTIKSVDQGDGSKLHRRVCLACGQRYQIVWEPPSPESGNDDWDLA